MVDLENLEHSPVIDELATVISHRVQNPDVKMFRIPVLYFLCKMASAMRVTVNTPDRGTTPVNAYCLIAAHSGAGKNYSMNILEREITHKFREVFIEDTFPEITQNHLRDLAEDRELKNGSNYDKELAKVEKEFFDCGEYLLDFSEGTTSAIKQMHHKLLMGKIGSLNLEIDEIGLNLLGNSDVLKLYLELFDQGLTKAKLIKNTAESKRAERVEGSCPANLLLFGEPLALFDGSKTEELMVSFWQTGYGRRCFYAFGTEQETDFESNAVDVYKRLTTKENSLIIEKWANLFEELAEVDNYNWVVDTPEDVAIELIDYKLHCERLAAHLPSHENIQKTELAHRYSKAVKVAGALAFIDGCEEMQMNHIEYAIKLAEESGEAFLQMLNREKNYVRVAKYIAEVDGEVTHADLIEKLPFYSKGVSARNELMNLAMAWAYKNNIVIQKQFVDSIEFFSGEALQETDINELIFSWSEHRAYHYQNEYVPFDQLHELTQIDGMNFTNHFIHHGNDGKGHRDENDMLSGFNCIVLDIDGTSTIEVVTDVLKPYKYHLYLTKSHDEEEEHRFRVIIPMKYILKLDEDEFREFMDNLSNWLPFEYDFQANQRNRKWACCDYDYEVNDGDGTDLFDPLQFIPRTSKNEEFQSRMQQLANYDNVERWFAERYQSGSRNNMLLRFSYMLHDSGMSFTEAKKAVLRFNKKLSNSLDKDEIEDTIFVSLKRKYEDSEI